MTDRVAWVALGLALLVLAVVRGLRNVLPGGLPAGDEAVARPVLPLVLAGLVGLSGAFPVSLPSLGVLLTGLALAALSLRVYTVAGARVPPPVRGAVAALALLFTAWEVQRFLGPRDLGADILVSAEAFALRLGLAGAAFGLFVLAGRREDRPLPGLRQALGLAGRGPCSSLVRRCATSRSPRRRCSPQGEL